MDEGDLNAAEKAAVSALRRLAKRWPNTLWLFSVGGSLHVMKKDDNGTLTDQRMSVATIDIENDGGDW